MSIALLGVSTLLQYVAAALALRLIWVTKHRAAWILVSCAVLLMGVRRSITFMRLVAGDVSRPPDLVAESVALLISILMVAGLAWVAPMFRAIEEARREVEMSEQRLKAILDNSTSAIFLKDLAGRYLIANRASEAIIGAVPGGIVGRTDAELMPPDLAARVRENDAAVLTASGCLALDEEILTSDGTRHSFLTIKFPVRDASGEPYAVGGISTDITERIREAEARARLEDRLREAHRMESLGMLAGGVAHDFNNLLTAILGNAELLQREAALSAESARDVDGIISASRTAAALCRQLLTYAGRGQMSPAAVDVSALVKEMVDLLAAGVSKRARVIYELEPDLPLIRADAAQVSQVVLNLITNASEALGDAGGDIVVSTGQIAVGPEGGPGVTSGGPLEEGAYLYLEVADTGGGMDAETRARLFEPFFTTKFPGRGLGLAAVSGIVRAHHGAVVVHSEPGQGTRMRVLFPIPAEPLVSAGDSSPELPVATERRTILLVDDEPLVRRVTGRILGRAGYDVVSAEDGLRALEVYADRAEEVALVLLDLTMPGLDGHQTMDRLRALDPELPVVIMSGHNPTAGRSARGSDEAAFIQKPFTARTLVEVVERALGGERGEA